MGKIWIPLIALTLGGCAATEQARSLSAAGTSEAAGLQSLSGLGRPGAAIAVRQPVGPNTYLGPMPTAVVLLREDQGIRNRRFCEGFAAVVPDLSAVLNEQGAAAPNMILVRWPVRDPASNSHPTTCNELLNAYAYGRSAEILSSFRHTATAAEAPGASGPYVMQFIPDGTVILVDGSDTQDVALGQWGAGVAAALVAQLQSLSATVGRPIAGASGSTAPNAVSEGETTEKGALVRIREVALAAFRTHVPYAKLIEGGVRWLLGPAESGAGSR